MSMYRVWDLETSVKTEFKRKANPFSPDNYIVCSGSCHAKLANPYSSSAPARTFGEYFPANAKGATGEDARERRIAACKALPKDWFTKLLKDTKILVGHNIKFDLLYALGNPRHRSSC
ncbi:hypothetical protein [Herbaspirillum sp. NPDC087042]|uniref:hypothetical protein n=1 Tax=Herbaspirillum sp. NPDC087042 TaxID=3364004 RepID=UPI00383068A9